MSFTARHDDLGHVTLEVELQRDLLATWTVTVSFVIDAGALAGLAHDVSRFIRELEFGADQRGQGADPPRPAHR